MQHVSAEMSNEVTKIVSEEDKLRYCLQQEKQNPPEVVKRRSPRRKQVMDHRAESRALTNMIKPKGTNKEKVQMEIKLKQIMTRNRQLKRHTAEQLRKLSKALDVGYEYSKTANTACLKIMKVLEKAGNHCAEIKEKELMQAYEDVKALKALCFQVKDVFFQLGHGHELGWSQNNMRLFKFPGAWKEEEDDEEEESEDEEIEGQLRDVELE